MPGKRTVYLVNFRAENGKLGGQRFYEKQQAENAAAALKRTDHKGVRIIEKRVR